MIDAVLSYHTNPATCGVAKFNQQLAHRLGVPHWSMGHNPCGAPLISIKSSEQPEWERKGDSSWAMIACWYPRFSIFAHDGMHGLCANDALQRAQAVYVANATIARQLRERVPEAHIVDAFCPATIQGNPSRASLNILTFGMAHKLRLDCYQKLKALLDASGQDYTVCLSTAVHEGSPWDAVADAGKELHAIFGDKLRELGYLADDALAKELQDCSLVALFFSPALRANNTTFWAAREAGQMVLTNLDADSPSVVGAINIDTVTELFGRVHEDHGTSLAQDYTWDRLLALMGVGVQV